MVWTSMAEHTLQKVKRVVEVGTDTSIMFSGPSSYIQRFRTSVSETQQWLVLLQYFIMDWENIQFDKGHSNASQKAFLAVSHPE